MDGQKPNKSPIPLLKMREIFTHCVNSTQGAGVIRAMAPPHNLWMRLAEAAVVVGFMG